MLCGVDFLMWRRFLEDGEAILRRFRLNDVVYNWNNQEAEQCTSEMYYRNTKV